eukprot:CAMPEP_0170577264 /NCGR_PEP_ID=MMETSP0224-20130122/4833_1 /TAXON_ID=285029 /ORGANISM="Togula jolla, Strain CCCM 725" /LENGTH=145 /DNA_ID=CAMNT_0010900161 /DNA_START=67 /DNA_END=501 /DNA_ORIENTATION=-
MRSSNCEDASGTRIIEDFKGYLEERWGCVVKAWRRVLDPNRDQSLLFPEFIEALTRTGWHGDASALWSSLLNRAMENGEDSAVGLREISPQEYGHIHTFQSWTVEHFGGPIEMFRRLTGNRPNACLLFEDFRDACFRRGYPDDAE